MPSAYQCVCKRDRRTLVQPFMLEVMMTCEANFVPLGLSFHFSRRGRNAKVIQYGPAALTLYMELKDSSGTSSKYALRNASALGVVGLVKLPPVVLRE